MNTNKFKILIVVAMLFWSIDLKSQVKADFTLDKNPAEYCEGDVVKFTDKSTNAKNLHWLFGDGNDTWTITQLSHRYLKAGTYKITLEAYDASAVKQSTSEKNITVKPRPALKLIHNESARMLTAQATPPASITYNWYKDKSLITSAHDANYSYFESGVYKSVITNDSGCSDSASVLVQIGQNSSTEDTLNIVVKNNVLTPNNDGFNDYLFIESLDTYQNPCIINIYNRWGSLVYSNTAYKNVEGFQGKSKDDKELDSGTYYYIVNSLGRKGGTGYIDIIR